MKHDDVRERLGDYLEGALALRDRALVDAHLDVCEPCLRELDDLRTTVRMLRALSAVDEPADVTAVVMRRIVAGEAEPSWWQRFVDVVDAFARPRALVAVAVGATALAGVLIFDPDGLQGPSPLVPTPAPGPNLATLNGNRPILTLERELGAARAPQAPSSERVDVPEPRVLQWTVAPGLPPHVELPLLEGDPMVTARTLAELRRRGLVMPLVQSKADVYREWMRQRQAFEGPPLGPPAFGPVDSTPVAYPAAQ